jgi:hypothetical protein
MIITKSVSWLDRAAHRSATSSAWIGVAHAFPACPMRWMRRWPLRPFPRRRCAGLAWMNLGRSYVIQGMRMLAVTWANDARGKSVFWLHVAVRHGTWPSVDDQLGITPRASSDSSGYIFAAENRVSAAHVPFSGDTPT